MPSLIGATIPEATERLLAAELRLGRVQEVETPAGAPGTVIGQSPAAGTSVLTGSSVDVTIARAPELVSVPNVAGLTAEDARQRLRAADLVPGPVTRAASDTLPADVVIATDPGAGSTLPPGSIVSLIVSDGPALARVLSVLNQTREEAEATLRAQGFLVEVYEETSGAIAPGRVTRQSPSAGDQAIIGTTVMIWISLGPEAPAEPPPPEDPGTD
jgi:eukaryotic-like serine/threonine-protein kinase